jgi:crotonobetainyl-CoA:carnitine CoA-transferase CaiB-like acyl-CoA transferase
MHKDTCTTPVLTVEEALTSDWSKSFSMLVRLAGNETVLNGPLKSKPPMRRRPFTRAPSLGENTLAVMRSLGYSRREVVDMRNRDVIESG